MQRDAAIIIAVAAGLGFASPIPPIPQPDPRFAWIAAIEKHGGIIHLEAKTYDIDRQYVLPAGTHVIGAGSGGAAGSSTIIRAVPTRPVHAGGRYHGCGANAVNRQGFVLGNRTHIAHLHYVGFETARYPDSHPLCGGAPIETPGCADAYCSSKGENVGSGEGVSDSIVEDVTIEGGTTQNAFWMPETRTVPCSNVTVRQVRVYGTCREPGPCKGSGTWADGINVHGAHHNVTIEHCTIEHSGDDAFAMWSKGDAMTDITFRGNRALHPRYPRTWLASCFAMYGGNRSSFVDNVCNGTGNRGMITFKKDFHGAFAANAHVDVHNDTVDEGKMLCGGMSFPSKMVDAPGCVE